MLKLPDEDEFADETETGESHEVQHKVMTALLDLCMRKLSDSEFTFGGFSAIFADEFRQFEPVKYREERLLLSTESDTRFEQNMNTIIILNNEHRFKLDVE